MRAGTVLPSPAVTAVDNMDNTLRAGSKGHWHTRSCRVRASLCARHGG